MCIYSIYIYIYIKQTPEIGFKFQHHIWILNCTFLIHKLSIAGIHETINNLGLESRTAIH